MKSTVEEIRRRFDGDVERFSNLETGQSATVDAPPALALVAEAAAATTPHAPASPVQKNWLTSRELPIYLSIGGPRMTTRTKAADPLKLTPLESLEQAAECLKTLAHPHRLR